MVCHFLHNWAALINLLAKEKNTPGIPIGRAFIYLGTFCQDYWNLAFSVARVGHYLHNWAANGSGLLAKERFILPVFLLEKLKFTLGYSVMFTGIWHSVLPRLVIVCIIGLPRTVFADEKC